VRHNGTVLVVDDDSDVRRSCAEVLRTAGYQVVEAENGLAALEHLKSSEVDAVLLDIFMPGLDGLSMLDDIEDPPPVALLTAHVYDEEIMTRRSKVAMYIQKPIAPLALLEALAQMLPRRLILGEQNEGRSPRWVG
jgi:CheY-like chemotaxis protein